MYSGRVPWAHSAVLALVLGSLIFPGGTATAQTAAERTLGLEALIVTALERNPSLAADRTAVDASREEVTAARGERLPRLDAVGLGEVFPRRERLLLFRHGFRGDDNPFETAIVNYGVELTLPLYTSGRIEHGISLAEARVEAARSRAELSREQLIFNVASGYYTALRAQEVITAQEAALASLKESLRIGEIQRRVGRLAPLDLLRLQTRVAQAERDLAGARNSYLQTLEVIKELANLPPEEFLAIAGTLEAAPTDVDAGAWRERALTQRSDVEALRHKLRAAREAAGIAGAALGPTLDLRASYRGVTGIDDGITKDDAQLFLQFRMPIFEGGVLRARERQALEEVNEAVFRLRAVERRALAEVQRAVLDLRATEPRLAAARRAVAQAEESLRVEREKFAQGRGTSNDLLLAEEALLRARTELARAIADSQIALASLRLAVGEDAVTVHPGDVR